MGLYYLPQGASYYQYLIKRTVGDDRPVEKIEEAIKKQMIEDFTAIRNMTAPKNSASSETHSGTDASVPVYSSAAGSMPLDMTALINCHAILMTEEAGSLSKPSAASNGSGEKEYSAADKDDRSVSFLPASMLSELREKITRDFPVLPDVSCDIKYVHESLQKYLSPAFYLTPAIDDYTNNVIYINPSSNYDDIELFTTLAHEGYPGHLYQSVYWNASKPDLLRMLLDTGGYTEGWATYVEMYSFGLWDENPLLPNFIRKTVPLRSVLPLFLISAFTTADTQKKMSRLFLENSVFRRVRQIPCIRVF